MERSNVGSVAGVVIAFVQTAQILLPQVLHKKHPRAGVNDNLYNGLITDIENGYSTCEH